MPKWQSCASDVGLLVDMGMPNWQSASLAQLYRLSLPHEDARGDGGTNQPESYDNTYPG
jgi:hypothetical protein